MENEAKCKSVLSKRIDQQRPMARLKLQAADSSMKTRPSPNIHGYLKCIL
ncbi:hypothetical protein PVK06_029968 [Gossypium arboreum]|uniref:Uncharacterized protein n=1 Tax=Gossypium arboreum TaxID=29729 RepID=A0ABR0NM17_GOSAR|nr:hypothetical protein PVK06_029968 [Gossypium arboreum]